MSAPKAIYRFAMPAALMMLALLASDAYAHGVAEGDKSFFERATGAHILPFIYLGAKHMVTGYDHLLFLLGVIFFLYRLREIYGATGFGGIPQGAD